LDELGIPRYRVPGIWHHHRVNEQPLPVSKNSFTMNQVLPNAQTPVSTRSCDEQFFAANLVKPMRNNLMSRQSIGIEKQR
jgi:hypothetical protein